MIKNNEEQLTIDELNIGMEQYNYFLNNPDKILADAKTVTGWSYSEEPDYDFDSFTYEIKAIVFGIGSPRTENNLFISVHIDVTISETKIEQTTIYYDMELEQFDDVITPYVYY